MPLPALRSRSMLGRLRRPSLHESPPALPSLLGQPLPHPSPKPSGVLRDEPPGCAAPCCCGVAHADARSSAAPSGSGVLRALRPPGGAGVELADGGPELANRLLACQAALGPRDSASGIGALSSALARAPAAAANALAAGGGGGMRMDDSAGSPGSVGVAGNDVPPACANSQLAFAGSGALACAGSGALACAGRRSLSLS